MSVQERNDLLKEISQLRGLLLEKEKQMAALDERLSKKKSECVIPPGGTVQEKIEAYHRLAEKIGSLSRGGDSVKDIAEMRER